jgi:hypothetical protein
MGPEPAITTVRVRLLLRWLTVALFLVHAYDARHTMNPDGVSYLEVSQAYLRGDPASLNFYWGPLLSVMLAGAQAILPLGLYWEATIAHGVIFVTFVLSLLAFEWLLTEVLRARRPGVGLPDWVVVGFAYGTFAWVARWGIKAILTPDMLVAAATYSAVALLLRLRREPETRWATPVLGAILGVGFLAKTVMLPVGLLVLGTLMVSLPWRWGWRHVLVAGATLALFAGPYVTLLSLHKGRLTLGESGRLNYYWEVEHGPRPERLALVTDREAPPYRLVDAPPVVALPTRPGVTYALWYDPSPWYDSSTGRLNLARQLEAWSHAGSEAVVLFRWTLAPVTISVLVLLGASFFGRGSGAGAWLTTVGTGLAGMAPLLLPALGASVLYSTTGVIEGRLIGPFVLLVLVSLVATLPAGSWRCCLAGVGVLAVVLLATLARDIWAGMCERFPHPHWRVAQRLREMGVRPGDGVGTLGSPYTHYWAHLAGTPAVAEVPTGKDKQFWQATPEEQERAFRAFREAGAAVVVAEGVPEDAAGWEPVPGTGYAIRVID